MIKYQNWLLFVLYVLAAVVDCDVMAARTVPVFHEPRSVRQSSEARPLLPDAAARQFRRWRTAALRPEISRADGLEVGDRLMLGLFDDAAYTAVIDRIHTNINGTVSIRARIEGDPMGYVLISTTGGQSLGTVSAPGQRRRFRILPTPDGTGHIAAEINPQTADELPDADAPTPPFDAPTQPLLSEPTAEPNEQAVPDVTNIDVMVVYTPAALTYAGGSTGMANTIAQAMEKAQIVLDNSQTQTTMTLVYSGQVDYTESGSSDTDLNRLTSATDGYIDEVHTLRSQYGGDLVAMFTKVEDVGGIAWQLYSTSGSPNYAFSITRVQQASWTYTTIHELGHNLGCHHHKQQNTQPGPGLYSYSAGWRWTGQDNQYYCSVMTYEEGTYFSDGVKHTRVAYFSNPELLHQGVPTGDAVDGDNARTVRQIRNIIAAYRADQIGSLQVSLSPQQAIDGGAQWRRVGSSAWLDSGQTEVGVPAGQVTIEFKAISGWTQPEPRMVSIVHNQTCYVSAEYVESFEVQIGSGTTTWEYPLSTLYHDARTQTIYLSSELAGANTFVGLALDVHTPPGQTMNNFTIRLKHTNLSNYNNQSVWESTGWTTVYQNDETITATGWVVFPFSAPFVYNGSQNLMVDISFNNSSYSSTGYCRVFSVPRMVRSLYYQTDSNYGDPLTWSSRTPRPNTGDYVPNIKLMLPPPFVPSADLDGSAMVDIEDFSRFARQWQLGCVPPTWCDGADFNQSGQVDLNDLIWLLDYWLE